MSWRKHLRTVNTNGSSNTSSSHAALWQDDRNGSGQSTSSKYSSYLPEVYAGHPNRIQRYFQYDDMDRDSDINAALDTIADFCTQSEEQNDEPFQIVYNDDANDTEVTILKSSLRKWVKLNDFKRRLWNIFRQTIKNGDQFFLCDPETGEWMWCDHFSVEMVKVDDDNKKPEEYLIRNLDINRHAKFAASTADPSQYNTPFGAGVGGVRPAAGGGGATGVGGGNVFQLAGSNRDPRSTHNQNRVTELSVIDATHVIHLTLSANMDVNWPFGQSILEPVFKTFKQKELLEDSIIIYRVQRAPERRIFYIDTGSMPANRAKAHIEQIKNEIHQRRIPNRTGGGSSIMDAAYNPLTIVEDYFFAQSAEGRGSKVETLAGGDNLGEIGDLTFFTKKMARAMRIPSSYLSLGGEDSGASGTYNDGRVGTAHIEEFRFNKYCMRLQSALAPSFDSDFKRYLTKTGIEIDTDLFELKFNPPQNFAKYRQMEIDAQQVGVYQQVEGNKKLAERFKLKRFLNLTEEEILENERLWKEENPSKVKKALGSTQAETEPEGDLTSVGLRMPGGGGDFDMGDMGDMDDFGGEDDMGGDGGPPPEAGANNDEGGGGQPPF